MQFSWFRMCRVGTLALMLLAVVMAAQTASAQSAASSAPTTNCETCGEVDFWIVSSRRCPQSGKGRCGTPGCCYDQFLFRGGRCLHQADQAAFRKWLDPDAPTCVVVHGSFTSFDALLSESRQLSRWLRTAAPHRRLNLVMYTWPSDHYPTHFFPIDINVLGQRSAFNGLYLAQFLQQLPPRSRLSLVGHSHGARTVAACLHAMAGGTIQGYRLRCAQPCMHRVRAVLWAAALDHHWLNPGERYGWGLCSVEALLNLRNTEDLALFFYPLRRPFSHRSLARRGFSRNDRCRLGSWNAKVAEIDVTSYVGRHHFWVHYFKHPEIAVAMSPYLFFTDDETRAVSGNRNVFRKPTTTASRFLPPIRESSSESTIRQVSARLH